MTTAFTLVAPGNDGVSAYKMVYVDVITRWRSMRGMSARGIGIRAGAEGEVSEDFVELLKSMGVDLPILLPDPEKAGTVFGKLHYSGKAVQEKHPGLYCRKCKRVVDGHDAKRERGKVTVVVAKFPLNTRRFILVEGTREKAKNAAGVAVDPDEEFLVYEEGREKWYVPRYLKDILLKEMVLHGDTYSVATGKELLEHDRVYSGRGRPRLLAPAVSIHDEMIVGENSSVKSAKVIYHREVDGVVLKCPRCGGKLKIENVEGYYLRTGEGFIHYPYPLLLASPKIRGEHRAHLKRCTRCGFNTTNMNVDRCPSCGIALKRDHRYAERFIPAGEIAEAMADGYVYIHTPQDIYDSLLPIHSSISAFHTPPSGKHLMVPPRRVPEADAEPEVIRAALVLKGRGGVRDEDIKKAARIRKKLLSVLEYSRAYGITEDIVYPEWIGTVMEGEKEKYARAMEAGRVNRAFDILVDVLTGTVSRWYLRAIRKGPVPSYVLEGLALMARPFFPSVASEIAARVGMAHFRFETDTRMRDEENLRHVREILSIAREIRRTRANNSIPLRTPMKRLVVIPKEGKEDILLKYRGLIQNLCNVITLDVTDEWDEITYDIIPKKDAVGMVYRQWIPKLSILLRMGDPKKIKREIEAGRYVLGIEGLEIRITSDMVEIREKVPEGYHEIDTPYGKFYVPLKVSDEERELGLVAEVARRIASMRKDVEMDYRDLITVTISAPEEVSEIVKKHEKTLAERVRALDISYSDEIEEAYIVEWGIGEWDVTIGITPMYREQVIKALTTFPHITPPIAAAIFEEGYVSIAGFMDMSMEELERITGYPRHMVRSILMYIESHRRGFPPISTDEGPACSLCGALLDEGDEFCGACGAPILPPGEAVEEKEETTAPEAVPQEGSPSPVTEKKSVEEGRAEEGKRVEVEESAEEKVPASAETLDDLESMGGIYLILEEKGRKTYELFKKLVESGKEGMIITREYPKRLVKKHSLPSDVKIFWLSNARKQNTIRPKDLEKISIEIDRFLNRGGKVIVLDGIEFLITNNSFLVVLRFIQSLKDLIAIEEGIMLLPVHPDAVKESEFRMLEKEVDEILSAL